MIGAGPAGVTPETVELLQLIVPALVVSELLVDVAEKAVLYLFNDVADAVLANAASAVTMTAISVTNRIVFIVCFSCPGGTRPAVVNEVAPGSPVKLAPA
jgi:hypothetical protein